jgi:phosphatidylglycerophosphate synthase
MPDKEAEGSLTRNSPWREKFNLGPVVDALDKLGIKANELTIIGGLVTVIGAAWAHEQNKPDRERRNWLGPLGVTTLGITADILDGGLARKQENDPNTGQLVDVIMDRISAIIRALLRADTARQRNSKWGEIAALAEAATLTWPSWAKTVAEGEEGKPVPEIGRWLSALGTHALRTILEIVAAVVPQLQPPIDTAITLGNISSTIDRLRIAKDKSIPAQLSPDDIDRAKTRKKYLEEILVIGSVAVLGCIIGGKIRDRNR